LVHTFEYKNEYFALDVQSGSVLAVDKSAYEAIGVLCRLDNIDAALASNSDDPIYAQIRELRDEGLLFSAEEQCEQAEPSVIKAMCLHLAHDCNLRCEYCFAKGGAFDGKRELMSVGVAKAAIDYLVAASGSRRNLEIDFFGGEPLLNFGVLKQTVEYARSIEVQNEKNFRFTVTTNGYKITDEMERYLNENMDNLVISIDGREQVHDATRKTVGGKGSYARVVENAKKLTLNRQGEYYVRGTFTADNLDFASDVLHVADLGFYGVSIEPVVTTMDNAIKREHLDAIYTEYERLADEYVKREKQGDGFVFFHFMVDLTGGPCRKKRIRGCGAGTEYIAVAPNGDIYPCHQFVQQYEYKMGSVFETGLDSEIAKQFDDADIYHIEGCSECWAKYYCSGGCVAANQSVNGDMLKRYEIGCDMQKKRLEIAIGMEAKRKQECEL
jgi:uncharacterized protein